MGRARKPLAEQKGHLTTEFQKQREYEEKLAESSEKNDLLIPPDFVTDKRAKAEYKYLAQRMLKMPIYCDLDRNNLGIYCNAIVKYIECEKILKKEKIIIEINDKKCENPVINIQKKYFEIAMKAGSACGLTVDGRLKASATKSNEINDKISDEFGDI